MTGPQVVIVGAGHAGIQVALSLREVGHSAPITVLGRENHTPYERPPLSKAWLKDPAPLEELWFRNPSIYGDLDIDLRTGVEVEAINRRTLTVSTEQGDLPYDHLVLATGSSPRQLPIPGTELAGVHSLHTLEDAQSLVANLGPAEHIVVIGGGFIGLEVAAAARAKGKQVQVIEAGNRVMQRAVTPEVSGFFSSQHQDAGIRLTVNSFVTAILGTHGQVHGVRLADGDTLRADLVVMGVGVTPNIALAEVAGIDCDDGVTVSDVMLTSDPHVSAVGDCANFPLPDGRRIRLESVQNAAGQARTVANRLTGSPSAYQEVPWFWSEQHGYKLQMAGLTGQADTRLVLGDPDGGKFTVLCWQAGVFVGGESVNRSADHIALRRLLASGRGPTQSEAAEPDFDLKTYARLVTAKV
ncbi:NAD(P)/FAD-dependent oxidoreductase [Prescottella sp. R16]|uniref:NAD(P)/FAD-dependent oxidoreductase n=1 Tax=Prescottella sp. R16 TaxID=3064529 RepID=UPI00272E74DB|nr:FAD-dependent oxidoreductase [Prescottella sp. R16]